MSETVIYRIEIPCNNSSVAENVFFRSGIREKYNLRVQSRIINDRTLELNGVSPKEVREAAELLRKKI